MLRTLRDRTRLFFIVVLPMILIVVLGMTYGGMSAARVGVADEDGGPLAVDLATAMTASDLRVDIRRFATGDQLRDAVERGFVELGVRTTRAMTRPSAPGAPAPSRLSPSRGAMPA